MNPRWNLSLASWDGVCQRCKQPSSAHIMSMFCSELICAACSQAERRHPDYHRAALASAAAYRDEYTDFPGIGKPADL